METIPLTDEKAKELLSSGKPVEGPSSAPVPAAKPRRASDLKQPLPKRGHGDRGAREKKPQAMVVTGVAVAVVVLGIAAAFMLGSNNPPPARSAHNTSAPTSTSARTAPPPARPTSAPLTPPPATPEPIEPAPRTSAGNTRIRTGRARTRAGNARTRTSRARASTGCARTFGFRRRRVRNHPGPRSQPGDRRQTRRRGGRTEGAVSCRRQQPCAGGQGRRQSCRRHRPAPARTRRTSAGRSPR